MTKIHFDQDDLQSGSNAGTVTSPLNETGQNDPRLRQGIEYGSLTRDLVAYYPFDGTVNDATPLGNDGTDNTSVGYVSGQVGSQAKDFDGTDDEVNIPFIDPKTSYTVSAFSKHESVSDGDPDTIIRTVANGVIMRDDGAGSLQFYHHDGSYTNFASASISNNTWNLWTITYDGNTVTAYKDGNSVGSASVGDVTSPSSGNQAIGSEGDSDKNYFDGQIDDVRIYDRDLSQPEIEALANLSNTSTVSAEDVL